MKATEYGIDVRGVGDNHHLLDCFRIEQSMLALSLSDPRLLNFRVLKPLWYLGGQHPVRLHSIFVYDPRQQFVKTPVQSRVLRLPLLLMIIPILLHRYEQDRYDLCNS